MSKAVKNKRSFSGSSITSHLTFAFSPFSAWQGRHRCSLPALAHTCCLLGPAEPLSLEAPGQHLPREVVLAQLSTAMVENWTPQAHNLPERLQGPESFILGLVALNNG